MCGECQGVVMGMREGARRGLANGAGDARPRSTYLRWLYGEGIQDDGSVFNMAKNKVS